MANKYVYIAICIAALSGCEKSTVNDPASTVDVGAPSATAFDNPSADVPASPPSSTMAVPSVVATDTTPSTTELPENKDVFALPPVTSSNEPVTVKRPVLDEVVAAPNARQAEVKLTAAALQEIQAFVAKSEQVCVVDFWSLACEPCLKEFPGLVRMHDELEGKVTCVSVNVDFDGRKSKPAEVYRTRVEDFLKTTNSTFQNFLCLTANEEVYSELKIVSIPAVLVFDAEGTLVRTFTDAGEDIGFTYEKDITPLVKSLLTQ